MQSVDRGVLLGDTPEEVRRPKPDRGEADPHQLG